jgi:hypothetical protein
VPAAPRTAAPIVDRSPLAGALAALLLIVGLVLASYTVLIPALLGLGLLLAAFRFLSARVNPFSMAFYIPVKPSWTAIAVVGIVGLLLLSAAFLDWRSGFGPLIPRTVP